MVGGSMMYNRGLSRIVAITHQLPKGLAVDEAVILGKEKSASTENQQSTTIESNKQTSAQQPSAEKVEG